MNYRVIVLSRAQAQISDSLNWLAGESIEGATRWLDSLDATLLKLQDDPTRHPLAPESANLSYEVREIYFHTPGGRRYRLLFIVTIDEVRILSLRSPGQDFALTDELI